MLMAEAAVLLSCTGMTSRDVHGALPSSARSPGHMGAGSKESRRARCAPEARAQPPLPVLTCAPHTWGPLICRPHGVLSRRLPHARRLVTLEWGPEGVPHLTRLPQRALLLGLDHHDGTRGVAADRRRRPAHENIEKAALAMRANDHAVDPERLGGGDDELARIPHLEQRRDRGLVGRMPARKACIFVAISSSIRTIWVSR